jgi:hypothetical protein
MYQNFYKQKTVQNNPRRTDIPKKTVKTSTQALCK